MWKIVHLNCFYNRLKQVTTIKCIATPLDPDAIQIFAETGCVQKKLLYIYVFKYQQGLQLAFSEKRQNGLSWFKFHKRFVVHPSFDFTPKIQYYTDALQFDESP